MKLWHALLIILGIIVLIIIIANISVVHIETLTQHNLCSRNEGNTPDFVVSQKDSPSAPSVPSIPSTASNLIPINTSIEHYQTQVPTHKKTRAQNKSRASNINVSEVLRSKTNVSDSDTMTVIVDDLLEAINDELVDTDYTFNMATLPVTVCYPNSSNPINPAYLRPVRKSLDGWSKILDEPLLRLIEMKPLMVQETSDEFEIEVNTKFTYQNKTLHLRLRYYGYVNRDDDFLHDNWNPNTEYHVQLIEYRPIDPNDYVSSIQASNVLNEPFMTMEEQLAYVGKIDEMHRCEEDW